MVSDHGLQEFASQEVYVSDKYMSVYCLMNCQEKVVPSEPLLLGVVLQQNEHVRREFKWTKTNESGNVDADIVKCKNHAFPSYLLCVEPNTLNYGEIYNFKAEMVNSDANSGIKVYVGQNISVSCVLNPLKGIRLITSFRISCTKSSNCHTCLVFELFDKFDSDLVELSGRMIATNNLGVFREFKITR